MKLQNIILALVGAMLFATGCKDEEYDGTTPLRNAAYIDVAEVTPETRVTFSRIVTTLDRTFSVKLVAPAPAVTKIGFAVDAQAVATYNARHATQYKLLPEQYYTFSTKSVTLDGGKSTSQPVTISFNGIDALDIDVTYLFPVTLAENPIGVLLGSETIFYLVRRSSAITTAADLSNCYMWIPDFETLAAQQCINGLSALTFEALVNVTEFLTTLNNNRVAISSIMGVEQHCLLRFGDTSIEREQLQTQIGGSKFPATSKAFKLDAGEWYHIALTWDLATKEAKIYVNGQVQSAASITWKEATIDLGLVKPDLLTARRFFIGYSYDPFRPLTGLIAEVRIWSVARTQTEIWRDMYEIADPASKPDLRAYWKFNEGMGNTAKDHSQYGHDAHCLVGTNNFETGGREPGTLKWNNSIEIPMLNQEN